MPFDGAGYQPNETVRLLDRMAEILGPEGEHWGKGVLFREDSGRYCLMGAALLALEPRGIALADHCDARLSRLVAAIYPSPRPEDRIGVIETMNDCAKDFAPIRKRLAKARERALLEETEHAV